MQSTIKIFKPFQRVFIEPPSRLKDVALRYKSRLLSLFLLPMIVIFLAVDSVYLATVPGYQPPWYGYIFLVGSYLLNRSGRYTIAALLTIAMFPIVVLASNITGEASNPLTILYYLIPGLILGGILLSIYETALFALIEIAVIFSMPYVAPNVIADLSVVIGPLSVMVISAVLVLVSMKARDQIEEDRQAKLRDSEERLRLALDAAQMGTWSWNIETGAVSWSEKIEPLFGMKPGEFDGKYETYLSLIHPEDLSDVQNAIERALANEDADYFVEHRIICPNGEVCWLEGRGRVNRNIAGKPVIMVGTVVDITDRKRADEALRLAEEKYRHIVEYAVYGIYQSTPAGKFLSVNRAMARIYGYDSTEEMLKSVTDIVSQVYVDLSDRAEFIRVLESEGEIYGFEARNHKRDGSIIWVSSSARTVRDAREDILYYEGTVEDITDRKAAEAERERLMEELAAKNTELERFVYTVSHDLKSPLVTIVGFLGYLEDDIAKGDIEALRKDVERIYGAAFKMQDLLKDLLELSRIGRMMNPAEEVSIDALVREAVELTEGRLQERGVEVHIEPGLPIVYGDRKRLLEVLQNLIDNAAKYMGNQPAPAIQIGQRGLDGGKPAFYVRDNGIGIAPEYHEQIFGLFNKLDPNVEGTGVGLALVKRIIEFHGGRIWVESEAEQGATFYFTLSQKEI
ncbi:MAG: PAS domain S-box protein [Anaerolineae bacterium]|nr:PAS domain S-box protein [Anaerolineae bacterium]